MFRYIFNHNVGEQQQVIHDLYIMWHINFNLFQDDKDVIAYHEQHNPPGLHTSLRDYLHPGPIWETHKNVMSGLFTM